MASTDTDTEEEMMMKKWLRALCYGMLMWGVTAFIGCAPIEPLPPPPSTPVSVSTFKRVAGKWAGILKSTPISKRKDDWVTLAIRNDGAYAFESVRTIGIFHGKGMLTLVDGKLRAETERGWMLATLYEEGGRRMLKVEAATKDGMQYSADLDATK